MTKPKTASEMNMEEPKEWKVLQSSVYVPHDFGPDECAALTNAIGVAALTAGGDSWSAFHWCHVVTGKPTGDYLGDLPEFK